MVSRRHPLCIALADLLFLVLYSVHHQQHSALLQYYIQAIMSRNKPEMLLPLASWAGNLQRNTADAFHKLNPTDYIRLITIICAYLLIRPYLMKIGAKIQQKEYDRKAGPVEMDGQGSKAVDSFSQQTKQLHNHRDSDSDSDNDSDGEREGEGVNWGQRARLRQRKIVRRALAEHERNLQEMQQTESDKEIEDLLIE